MDAYPDAKFILSMRDPKSWFKSVCDTIRMHVELRDRWPIKMLMFFKGQGKITKLTNMMGGPDADPVVKGR